MDNEQLIKEVIQWLITTKNTDMLDESDVNLIYNDYIASLGVNPEMDQVTVCEG